MILADAIKAAGIHKKVSAKVYEYVRPGISVGDIIQFIEENVITESGYDSINPLFKGRGFPIGIGINNCAAHWTLNSVMIGADRIIGIDDIVKIDFGTHSNLLICDSAFTLHFNPKFDELIQISKDTTEFAIRHSGIDVNLGELGGLIEEFVKSHEIEIDGKVIQLKTMSDICGHNIARGRIHNKKAVPNIGISYNIKMEENEIFAIEPFITTGKGRSILGTNISHYAFDMNYKNIIEKNRRKLVHDDMRLIENIENYFSTLPFCEKWITEMYAGIDTIAINNMLKKLESNKIIQSYPPIYDIEGSYISQFEHNIFIRSNGVINLTKNVNY